MQFTTVKSSNASRQIVTIARGAVIGDAVTFSGQSQSEYKCFGAIYVS
jgi:hypothetical protein